MFDECALEVGATVTAVGLLMRDVSAELDSSEERGFREGIRPTNRLAGTLEHPLLISDALP